MGFGTRVYGTRYVYIYYQIPHAMGRKEYGVWNSAHGTYGMGHGIYSTRYHTASCFVYMWNTGYGIWDMLYRKWDEDVKSAVAANKSEIL